MSYTNCLNKTITTAVGDKAIAAWGRSEPTLREECWALLAAAWWGRSEPTQCDEETWENSSNAGCWTERDAWESLLHSRVWQFFSQKSNLILSTKCTFVVLKCCANFKTQNNKYSWWNASPVTTLPHSRMSMPSSTMLPYNKQKCKPLLSYPTKWNHPRDDLNRATTQCRHSWRPTYGLGLELPPLTSPALRVSIPN